MQKQTFLEFENGEKLNAFISLAVSSLEWSRDDKFYDWFKLQSKRNKDGYWAIWSKSCW